MDIFKFALIVCTAILLLSNTPLVSPANTRIKCDSDPATANIHIKNFAKVDENYYRSGQPDIKQFDSLSRLGIKTMINLREPFRFNRGGLLKQQKLANSLGMNYINIPMDPRHPPSEEQLDYFFCLLDDPKNLPVLVYDANGQDRVGVMAALYRIRYNGWNYDQAYTEMKSFGYHPHLYPALRKFLEKYATSNNKK